MVFEDSLGGTYAGALHYIEVIKRNDINTVVKGKCFSACALAFLAGKQRSIGSATGVTAISLHSSRILVDGVPQEYTDKRPLMSKIYELTGGKMKPEVLELIRKSWTEASGVVFVAYSFLGFTHFKTLYCDGTQGADTSKCTRLANADPYEMGVLTKR
ncbi:hypothetical protein GCM10023165_09270 [Variovorax defluvii]|uniref:Uncharacterized protein n=2 Tax=Variovorax defluvii TaxID=913761 RepID=A0ABP8H3M7_9BURK